MSHEGLSAANDVEKGLLNGDPDGFTFVLGFDDLLFQFVEPFTAFEDFTYTLVATNENAALGVLGGVARVDSDTLPLLVELGATEQDGKPLLELRTPADHHGVATFGDGRAAFYLVGPVGIVVLTRGQTLCDQTLCDHHNVSDTSCYELFLRFSEKYLEIPKNSTIFVPENDKDENNIQKYIG